MSKSVSTVSPAADIARSGDGFTPALLDKLAVAPGIRRVSGLEEADKETRCCSNVRNRRP
jgi:hypothetical protein